MQVSCFSCNCTSECAFCLIVLAVHPEENALGYLLIISWAVLIIIFSDLYSAKNYFIAISSYSEYGTHFAFVVLNTSVGVK